jgi:hypothetical protein
MSLLVLNWLGRTLCFSDAHISQINRDPVLEGQAK